MNIINLLLNIVNGMLTIFIKKALDGAPVYFKSQLYCIENIGYLEVVMAIRIDCIRIRIRIQVDKITKFSKHLLNF